MSFNLFHSATIIGVGLIGSSLARALRNKGLVNKLYGVSRSEENCKKLLDLNIVDEAYNSPIIPVQKSDLIVVCTPVGSVEKVIQEILPFVQNKAIISDVGSVKGKISKIIVPDSVSFVPAHPVAGTEKSGPENGFAELFENRWCILTPTELTNRGAVEKVSTLWTQIGMKVEIMTPERHDVVMALMSHLPHLIAYTIVGTASDLEKQEQYDVLKYAAGGFRDFTRIAGSDPIMWRDIFLNNQNAVLDCLQRFTEDLTSLQRAIRHRDSEALVDWFKRTRVIRKELEEIGQAQPENEKMLLKGKKI
ncbi:MAG: prephenate/arogenate dehydrogenase family protein [Alphaproteobacteria bacterium]|nr:prephenate/arogenate dehydrogenase family protein [Alphaproteobacteria bacterium]